MHYRPEKATKSIRDVLFTLLPFFKDFFFLLSCRLHADGYGAKLCGRKLRNCVTGINGICLHTNFSSPLSFTACSYFNLISLAKTLHMHVRVCVCVCAKTIWIKWTLNCFEQSPNNKTHYSFYLFTRIFHWSQIENVHFEKFNENKYSVECWERKTTNNAQVCIFSFLEQNNVRSFKWTHHSHTSCFTLNTKCVLYFAEPSNSNAVFF